MATKLWRGDAAGVPQITWLTPGETAVAVGDRWSLTINRKTITVTAGQANVANLISLMKTAIESTSIAEFQELTPSTGLDAFGNPRYLILTGPSDGKPFTVTSSNAPADALGVSIAEIQKGSAAVNERQLVTIPSSTSGGTFTLTFEDETTGAIAYNGNAAAVQSALEALSNIAAGDVTVSGASPQWTVEFTQAFAGQNVPLMVGNGDSLTGAVSIRVELVREGVPFTNEVQKVARSSAAPDYFRLSYRGATTDWIAPSATAAEVEAELEALATIGANNVSVTTATGTHGSDYLVAFIGEFERDASEDPALLSVAAHGGGSECWVTHITDHAAGVSEQQRIMFIGATAAQLAGDTFTLTFEGATTGAITFSANPSTTAGNIATALEALANLTDVTVAADTNEDATTNALSFTVTFGDVDPDASDVSLLTGTSTGMTGGRVDVHTVQTPAAAVNEVIDVTLTGSPTGGAFTLTYSGQTTSGIAYNAAASAVTSALEALSNIGVGDVTVTANGTAAGGYGWRIEFTGALAGADQLLTASGASLTGAGSDTFAVSTAVAPTGPHHWDNANNWDAGAVPANSDDVVFENSNVDCLYGLDASAVTLTSLTIKQSYTGKIGLAVKTDTDYYEYRETYLEIGATTITIGAGEGEGSQRLKINTGSVQTTMIVVDSGQSADALPAILWKGTHASNVVRVSKGAFGAALLAGETAAIATLAVGYREDQEADAQVFCGSGVTLTNVDISGGLVEIASATTTIDQTAGLLVITAAAHASIDVDGGRLVYKGTGTITTLSVSGEGQADFSQDMRAKTITNAVQLYDGASLLDPYGIVALSAGFKVNRTKLENVTIDLGPDRTYTVS
jgi:hypothetical protein